MSERTVFCETFSIRQVELIELPSTNAVTTEARLAVFNLFIQSNICLSGQEAKLLSLPFFAASLYLV